MNITAVKLNEEKALKVVDPKILFIRVYHSSPWP